MYLLRTHHSRRALFAHAVATYLYFCNYRFMDLSYRGLQKYKLGKFAKVWLMWAISNFDRYNGSLMPDTMLARRYGR